MITKNKLRSSIKAKRGLIDIKTKRLYDNSIYNKLIQSEVYKRSSVIFIYVSCEGEVDTHKIIKQMLEDGKKVCVPKVISKDKGMEAVEIKKFQDLKIGKYGILEPQNMEFKILPEEIDLVILPGLVFDMSGGRIGYGGGFYDRFLRKLKDSTLNIGIAYDFQIVDKVPQDKWDVCLDGIITNSKVYNILSK